MGADASTSVLAARAPRRGVMIRRPVRLRSRGLAAWVLPVLFGAAAAVAADDDRHVDRSLGFSFSKPRFAPSEAQGLTTVAVTLAGAPDGGFAPNVNVVVENVETTIDAYQQRQAVEMKAAGWEVLEQTQVRSGGRPALRTHARGAVQGVPVEFLAVATTRDDRKLFVLTCTTTTTQFPKYQAEFERVVASFLLVP